MTARFWAPVAALCLVSAAHADIFKFSDVEGYEKCLTTDHLVERTNTSTGDQGRFLNATDVQIKCTQSAGKMFQSSKDVATMKEFVKTTKRNTAPENAIEIVAPLVKASVAACNDMEVYEVLKKILSGPSDDSASSYFQKGKKVVLACLKDKEFKKDFLEEKDSDNSYVSENACAILREQKLVSSCKKG